LELNAEVTTDRLIERRDQFGELRGEFALDYGALEQKYEAKCLEVIEYKQQAHCWEGRYGWLKSKYETLEEEFTELKAHLRQREQQLFGKKSEKATSTSEQSGHLSSSTSHLKNPRGQQRGKPGHGRRAYGHLPEVEETVSFAAEETCCPECKLPYQELPGTEDSEVLEVINVKAYRRLIRRKMYKRSCRCPSNPDPQIQTAPVVERLISKSKLGITIWAFLLLKKYGYQQPLHRALLELKGSGLSLSMGTVTEGFAKILPLLVPVYDAIAAKSKAAKHWHADETGWKVFEAIENKKSTRWYLWVFHNTETVLYRIDPSRSSNVLREHFGEKHTGGTLNVDRYSAYKAIAKNGLFILAFCWAHVRRDFLSYSKGHPKEEEWGLSWVEAINGLYHINNQRIEQEVGSPLFGKHDLALREALNAMQERAKQQGEDKTLSPFAKKLLTSLENHWGGLTIFVGRPEIPMDNNQAERSLRGSVVGRKNYYGSGAIWSAELAAALFTIFETLKLWKINLHTWLLAYFQECAIAGGQSPTIKGFLPWEMSSKQKELLSQPPRGENSS
jgi:transposase